MGRRTRKGVRVLACRSMEPEQSLGPWSKPVCARMGSDGRGGGRHRCVEGSAGCGGSADRRALRLHAQDLVAWLRTLSPALVATEATGGFETVVATGLASAGLPVVVVNPAQVRAFA